MSQNISSLLDDIYAGDFKAISRAISLVENGAAIPESTDNIQAYVPVIGLTGPPGAGKSTLTDRLIGELEREGNSVAVLCADPSSPFTHGAILGDRIRMSEWYDNPSVFIRSIATRGSLGGLPEGVENIINLLRMAPFDYILIETVGVGQNEVQISSLADCTVVVLVPESGDDIQMMKAGLMEIADVFVVNKCDRPGADLFANDIKAMLHGSLRKVVKTIANTKQGVGDLISAIKFTLEKKGK